MTRLGDRIPVERLDPARLDRIERQVLSAYRERALDPRPRRLHQLARWLVPAVAVAGVAFAVFLNLRGLRSAAPPPRPSAVAQPVVTAVDTTTGGQTRLELGDAVVIAAADSRLEIERGARGAIAIALATGSVDCEVAPRGDRPPFVVRAGEVAVTVIGTGFRVERSAAGDRVRVAVRHGRVRVDAIGGSVGVAAGEDWSGPATRVAAATPVPEPSGDQATAPAPPVEEPRVALRPHHTAPPPPSHPNAPAAAPPQQKSVAEERAARLAVAPQRSRPDGADAGELAAIMKLEESDPKAAIRKYQKLALSEGGDTARFALYSMAHVQYFQLHQRKAAISTARRFENRFPSGRYAEDVLWLRIRATCDVAIDEECRAAAHAYVESFPHGAYADRAREIITWM